MDSNFQEYCSSLSKYKRLITSEVKVGDIGIGGNNPILIQSMTTTNTMDTAATIQQSIKMIEAGCQLVRITAPSINEAKNLKAIKEGLKKQGYNTPLVADIHFTPNAAEEAARIVEKVRINPGNYADKKKFQQLEYTDASYQQELQRIKERFLPLIGICKEYGTAMRIGTNHGSLSDRIMSRYGDTPMGMVESAMEFIRICRQENYHQLVVSMKSSNPQVMVQAYRLLVKIMHQEGMAYPLHLGVTEAGEGEDGRIKSAVGIGTLLEDGLGDTIRVSLTEAPEEEMPVAKILADRYSNRAQHQEIPPIYHIPLNPYAYEKRSTHQVFNIGDHQVPRVIMDYSNKDKISPASLFALGYHYNVKDDKWTIADHACDYIFLGHKTIDFPLPGTLGVIQHYKTWVNNQSNKSCFPFIEAKAYLTHQKELSGVLNFVYCNIADLSESFLEAIKTDKTLVLILNTSNTHGMAEQRRLIFELVQEGIKAPIIIGRSYSQNNPDILQMYTATDMGALLIDGMGDGVFIAAENHKDYSFINKTAFGILQATRMRISKTEYISCPSCGRTLFDLQETTAKIRKRTDHLKGLKIGIMGCIVNGPGEMADADYGYVGTGPGKITLYKEKEVVLRNVPALEAVEELVNLIKTHGDWVEPQ